jgi:hypothetical protein
LETLLIRFLVGGFVVSLFAALGEILRPKSFAGLFGAAPSIALATLGLTIHQNGRAYATVELHSMILGAIGFFTYAFSVGLLLRRYKPSAILATITLLPIWFVVSFGLWLVFERPA